jgi:PAS domain S-box-containing protein
MTSAKNSKGHLRKNKSPDMSAASFNELKKIMQQLRDTVSLQDATIRKLEFEKLMFDTLMLCSEDKIYFKDRQNRFLKVNKNCAAQHHLDDPAELTGKTDFDFFSAESAKEWMDEERGILATGKPVLNKEELEDWQDGRKKWVSTSKLPVRDKYEKIVGTFGISRDITKIKLAEKHLQNLMENLDTDQLQTLMDNVPDKIYFKDKESRFIRINKATIEAFGFRDPGDILGKTDFDIFTEEHARDAYNDERQILKTGISIVGKEELETWKDGRRTWASTTKMPFKDVNGKTIGTFGISRDITHAKTATEQLQTLMDNIPDRIYFKDEKSRFIRINKATADSIPVNDPDDVIGKTDFDLFTREHAQPAYEDEQWIMKTGKSIVAKEEYETWTDGRRTWVSTTKLPFRDMQGRIIGTFGLSRDITEKKLAEKKLKEAKEELEQKVQERTAELKKANVGMAIRIAQLDYLNVKAHAFAQLNDRDTLLSAIFHAFCERVEEGEIILCEKTANDFRPVFYTKRLNDSAVLSSCVQALNPLESNEVNEAVFEDNWMEHHFYSMVLHKSLQDLPSYAVIPLTADRKVRGAVQLFTTINYKERYKQEKTVLTTLATQAAVSLDNVNYYQELSERARIQSELEIAHGIQKRFTPRDPEVPHFSVKGVCLPANEVGGDYLDYFQNRNGDWVMVIADVCGKGIPAALVMTSLRSSFRCEARELNSSQELLCAVNDLMLPDLKADNTFITCICLIIGKDGRYMNYTHAGHPMLIMFKNNNSKPEIIQTEGVAMGIMEGKEFRENICEVNMRLQSGDRLLAYTDGLIDTINADNEMYGLERLLELFEHNTSCKPDVLVDAILQDLNRFSHGLRQRDDLTLFALERL